jgi:hypothetical protein
MSASERSERATGAERAGGAASERRGVRGAKPLGLKEVQQALEKRQ